MLSEPHPFGATSGTRPPRTGLVEPVLRAARTTSTDRSRSLDGLLRMELVAATFFIGLFVYTAMRRVTFPFELEWEEGAFMDHVLRILHGQQLYVPPSLDFIPFVYTPGYYYVAAGAATVFGASMVTLRMVSVLCAAGTMAVLAAFGRRERGSTVDGVLLAGLFAATYAIGGAWFDIARVDSLFLLLVVAAVYLLRFGDTCTAMAVAGLLLAGALLTKQVALILAPPLLMYPVLRLGRRGLVAPAVFLCTILVTFALLQWSTDGWFLYYTFHALTKTQAVFADRALSFWTTDLLKAFPIGTVLGLGWCILAWRVTVFEDWTFYAVAGVAFLVSAWETRLHPGAWVNTLLPAYCFLAMAALRAARLLDRRLAGLGSALLIAQMALLLYNPHRYIPSAADRVAADTFLQQLRAVPGEVLVLDHGYFPSLAGKRTHAHEMAVRDVLLTDDEWSAALSTEIRDALSSHKFAAIVQDTPDWFPVPLGRYYRRAGHVHTAPDVLWPPTGNRVRPEFVYLPK